jgi:hypothetical protein
VGLRGLHANPIGRKLKPRPRRMPKPRVVSAVVSPGPIVGARLRQQRHRQREKNGQLALTVEVNAAEIIELLVEAQLLDPHPAFHGRAEIAAGIGRFLSLCCHA